ncbi:MAG: hypothetical protein E6I01_14035 [Chloroflexi bacterium]|nr:MAG: hypothetical protein E6I01_14035 [Chloroflexota bacterium]
MTRPLHVAFVWHMHQPYYKDDLQHTFLLPWVRLRCAKDYYKMPALLDDYPAIKQTFNLVPALVAQVADYVDGQDTDDRGARLHRPLDDRVEPAPPCPPVSTLPGPHPQARTGLATHRRRHGEIVLGRGAPRPAGMVQPLVDRPRSHQR